MMFLSPKGYHVPLGSLSKKELVDVRKELTMTPVNSVVISAADAKSFPIFSEDGERKEMIVPKYYGLRRFGVPSNANANTIVDGTRIDVPFMGHLREEQLRPLQEFMLAAEDPGKMGGILSLSCGQGRSLGSSGPARP